MAGNFKYPIHNATAAPVLIKLDSRETHVVGPAATVIFMEANKLDNPTFYVYATDATGTQGNLLYEDTFFTGISPFSWSRGLIWTGSKLEDD